MFFNFSPFYSLGLFCLTREFNNSSSFTTSPFHARGKNFQIVCTCFSYALLLVLYTFASNPTQFFLYPYLMCLNVGSSWVPATLWWEEYNILYIAYRVFIINRNTGTSQSPARGIGSYWLHVLPTSEGKNYFQALCGKDF